MIPHCRCCVLLLFIQEKPYVMLRENRNFTGNDRYEGFCIDLLRRIAGLIGFEYTIRLVPDHMYGVYDRQTKQWNGIVRELMERVRDDCPAWNGC